MQELAQEVALSNRQNIWIDGSLGDHEWYSAVFDDIKERHPDYKIAIFYVYCDPVRQIGRERGPPDPSTAQRSSALRQDQSGCSSAGCVAIHVMPYMSWFPVQKQHTHTMKPGDGMSPDCGLGWVLQETVYARASRRGTITGRHIPRDVLARSIESTR